MKIAVIDEESCVGCTKCLPACPVDAIVGSSTFMHTVITDECIGCGLCVAPCPMDCITMVESEIQDGSPAKLALAEKAKKRVIAKRKRIVNANLPLLPNTFDEPAQKAKMRAEMEEAFTRIEKLKYGIE